jgi:biotin transport system substrate-specific component
MTSLHCVCAWITIPVADFSFTMQSFSVLLSLELLGGKWGTISIVAYLLAGIVGFPVFSSFQSGVGIIVGPTGGYLIGFLLTGFIYWGVTRYFSERFRGIAMIGGLLGCYCLGTIWFYVAYANSSPLIFVVLRCVVPYLVPDAIKLILAYRLSDRIRNTSIFRT